MTVRAAIHAKGSWIAAKINEKYNNIPSYLGTTPSHRATFIANSVRVKGYTIGQKEQKDGAGAPQDKTRFAIFMEPPALDAGKHREWISVLNRTATTRFIVCDGELTAIRNVPPRRTPLACVTTPLFPAITRLSSPRTIAQPNPPRTRDQSTRRTTMVDMEMVAEVAETI